MSGKKYVTFIIILILCAVNAKASYRTEIYNCYITGNMVKWKAIIDKMASEKRKDPAAILELVNYQYGYIGWAIGIKKSDEAKDYLKIAEENLVNLGNYPSCNSIVNAYKAAFYGFRIGLNKVLAPFLGGKSLDCARAAIKQDDRNHLAYVQLGNSEFYMPAALGGSKTKALEYFTKAQEIMESDQNELKENWNYLSLLTVIAQAYSYTGDYNKSKQYLDKILTLEPEFVWVKNELYQQIYNRMKN
jgi:tetratricopeptide (TPR) repeat protein